MRTIIIISRCLKIKKAKNTNTYLFHFKGVYLGQQVNSLELIHSGELSLGHDYVMRVKVHSLDVNRVLKGDILYAKDLDDISSH